jgi:hypothetical protein
LKEDDKTSQSGASQLRKLEMGSSLKVLGDNQFKILTLVCEQHYDQAVAEIKSFQKLKSNYPKYKEKTARLFEHAEGLVKAIETKLNFPNLSNLPPSKQDEIYQKINENWDDLKLSLRRVKTIESDFMVQDARSSIYVVRAILFSFIFLLVVFLLKEFTHSFGGNMAHFWSESSDAFFDIVDHL